MLRAATHSIKAKTVKQSKFIKQSLHKYIIFMLICKDGKAKK